MGWGSIGGAISGAVNAVTEAVAAPIQVTTTLVADATSAIPGVSNVTSATENLVNKNVEKAQTAVNSSGDNLANANSLQRALINPFLAPDLLFDPNYAKGLQAALTGDFAGAKSYLASAGVTPEAALSKGTESGPGAAVDSAIEAILPAGAAEAYRGMSTAQKLVILSLIGVGGFFIWRKFIRRR